MMKKTISLFTLGACAALFNAPVAAQTVLNVSTWLPPSHVQNRVVWPTWAEWVEEATEGRIKVNIEYTSSNPTQLFDMVEDGVTDAAFSFHGFIPGRFDLQEVIELPGVGANAEAASSAYWRTYQEYFTESGEHDGLELLALFTHGPGVMQTNFPVNDLDDLKGKKIRVGGGVQAEIGDRLQIVPVAAPGNKAYELLQTGVVDGVFMPVTEQKAQRLYEVAPYITTLPQGMYLGSWAMFISPDFMDSISPEDAEAIRSVSGERLSVFAGRSWDEEDEEALQYAIEKGVTVNHLDEDDPISIEYQEKMRGLDKAWLKRVADKGVDAKAALDMVRELVAEYTRQE